MKKLLLVGMIAIGFAHQATAMYQNIPKPGTRVKQIKERIKLSQEQEEYEQGQDWKSLQPSYYLALKKYQNGMFSGIRDYVGWLTSEDDLSKTIALSEKIALFKKDRDVFIRHKQRNEE